MASVARVAGFLPLVGAVMAAAALTGAAVFTVSQAGCADPAHYVQYDGQVRLVGGCFQHSDLPTTTQSTGHGTGPQSRP